MPATTSWSPASPPTTVEASGHRSRLEPVRAAPRQRLARPPPVESTAAKELDLGGEGEADADAEAKPLEPTTTTENLAATLNAQLRPVDGATVKRAARILHRDHCDDARGHATAAAALLASGAERLDNGRHVAAMTWPCNALGASADPAHATTLEEVARRTRSRKVKAFAEMSRKLLSY